MGFFLFLFYGESDLGSAQATEKLLNTFDRRKLAFSTELSFFLHAILSIILICIVSFIPILKIVLCNSVSCMYIYIHLHSSI